MYVPVVGGGWAGRTERHDAAAAYSPVQSSPAQRFDSENKHASYLAVAGRSCKD